MMRVYYDELQLDIFHGSTEHLSRKNLGCPDDVEADVFLLMFSSGFSFDY